MAEQTKPQRTLTVPRALILLAGLIGLLQLSFWADQKSYEVEGPDRIVRGPRDTLAVQIDRKIVMVSADGEVQHVVDLDADAGIPEHIADFFVEDDGRLLIARRDSQLLQYYTPEGKLIKTHARVPSALVEDNHFCKFTKDAATGIVYFADTSHHRILMYGRDEKEFNSISIPFRADGSQSGTSLPQADQSAAATAAVPLSYPNGLLFERDRLIATDTGNARVLIFYPNGTLEKAISLDEDGPSGYVNPFRVGRYGDNLYVIVRGPNFLGGEVAAFDLSSGQAKNFMRRQRLDPWDVFARATDVLVADRESLSVLRYSHAGEFLGVFGKTSLQNLYAERQVARKTYQWLRYGSLAGMFVILGGLLVASRKQRMTHESAGVLLYPPIETLQRVLGQVGSARRNILLVLVPGLGQAAAGRVLRAVSLSIPLLFFAILVIFSWLQYRETAAMQLPLHITVVLMFFTVWMAIILDGVRLSGRQFDASRTVGFTRFVLAVAAPLLTLSAASIVQMIREWIVRGNSEASFMVQGIFRTLMSLSGDPVPAYAALIPAAIVFGWGGAIGGMFGVLAWQANLGTKKILAGIVVGLFAGLIGWTMAIILVGNKLGWLFYIQPVLGAIIGFLAYLYFKKDGMPWLVVPTSVAGAWAGDFLRMMMSAVLPRLRYVLPSSYDTFWIGTFARLDFILWSAFFIHLAIWIAWNVSAARPVGSMNEADEETP